jgi:pre-mRNA-processing factor SLU7
MQFTQLEEFVKAGNEKTSDELNNISMPTQAELFHRHVKDKKIKVRSDNLKRVLSKYGGEEHLEAPEEIKNIGEVNNTYVEYNQNGKIKRAPEKRIENSSIYSEDVHTNGHSSVWGSFYNSDFGWGYKCCYSFEKNSFCQGIDGKKENKDRIVKK